MPPPRAPSTSAPAEEPGWTVAAENDKPGTADWPIRDAATDHEIEAFADRTSVVSGHPVTLYVSTTSTGYVVRAYRMGWYHGDEAREVWVSAHQRGVHQLPARVDPKTHTATAPWQPSMQVPTDGFPPGDYLLRLDADSGKQWFVPLTIRAARAPEHPVVIVNAVTTWQAYNNWGGYSLYHGKGGLSDYVDRARIVSFDRPYAEGAGSGDFLGNELPALALAEKLGLPLAYATSIDLDRDPTLLDGAAAVLSLGHDEYWSSAMRASVTSARDRGTNVAFLGANAIYRHIRFADGPLGPDRLIVDYKDAHEDPLYGVDDAQVTVNWRDPPLDDPETSLTGVTYQCNPVDYPLVVADASSWLFAGAAVHDGEQLPGLVGTEYDRVDLTRPQTPRPIEILFHSPLRCRGHADAQESAYYTTSSGAGVFDSGTSSWVCALDDICTQGRGDPRAQQVIEAVTTNLFRAFAAGPAGQQHPAVDNVSRVQGPSAG